MSCAIGHERSTENVTGGAVEVDWAKPEKFLENDYLFYEDILQSNNLYCELDSGIFLSRYLSKIITMIVDFSPP